MTKILITGALGHIGSYLIHHMKGDITAVDNFSTQRYCSLLALPPNVRFLEASFDSIEKEIEKADVIIHLAAMTDAAGSLGVPREEVFHQNVSMLSTLIGHTERSPGTILVYPSTTSLYGKGGELGTVYEEDGELQPQSPYAESKLRAEEIIQERCKNTRYYILRFGTIFGISRGMRFHTAINKLCLQAHLRQKLTVWKSHAKFKRPYLALGDAQHAIDLILKGKVEPNQIYNVVTENCELQRVLEWIAKYHDPIQLDYIDAPILNQESYIVDCSKFHKEGFRPMWKLSSGIEQTITHLKRGQHESVNHWW